MTGTSEVLVTTVFGAHRSVILQQAQDDRLNLQPEQQPFFSKKEKAGATDGPGFSYGLWNIDHGGGLAVGWVKIARSTPSPVVQNEPLFQE